MWHVPHSPKTPKINTVGPRTILRFGTVYCRSQKGRLRGVNRDKVARIMGKCSFMYSDGDCSVGDGPATAVDSPPKGKRPTGPIAITKSVGQSAPNLPDDVFQIQYGLNQVAPIDGGPNPQLKIDSKCGPKTIGAIRAFQLKHFGWKGNDGVIEPGKQTIAKLNEVRNPNVFPGLPLDLVDDGWLLAGMLQHIPHTRNCIVAAMAKVNSAMLGLSAFGDSARTLVDRHYKIDFDKSSSSGALQMIYDTYSNMLQVIARPDVYITLDTDDGGEGISTIAFARLGGFFDKKDLSGKIWIRRGAYFASGIQDFAAFVFIHELRHFVDRQQADGHQAKGWVTDQGMTAMRSEQRLLNCDTYGGFALEAHNGVMDRPGWVKASKFR